MTLLMFDQHPLILDKKLARAIGLNQAMILQQVHYWLEKNKKDGRNLREGRYWTYNTIDEWQEEFPFWSRETVKRSFNKLRDMGFLLTGNFNVYKMDRTLWYAIDYEKLKDYISSIYPDENIENELNDHCENEPMEEQILTPAIPETSSKTTKETNKHRKSISQDLQNKEGRGLEVDPIVPKNNFKDKYDDLLCRCRIHEIDASYRDACAQAIKLLLLDSETKEMIEIGEQSYPADLVRDDLNMLNQDIVEYGIIKFIEASEKYKIKNTIGYLKSCIYNAIYEMDIELEARMADCQWND